MKFSCEKNVLLRAVNTASRAASGKSPIPSIEGLLIEARDGMVKITGYDLKKGIFTSFSANVEEDGVIVLGARLFGEITRSMPDGIVKISVENGNMTSIICKSAEFKIMGSDAQDYPELPAIDYQSSVSVSQKILKNMINETVFAVSDNESRPIYTGSLFEIEDKKLTIVSVDGFRLALRREAIDGSDSGQSSFVVPGAALNELEKICSDIDEPVIITLGSKHISFSIGDTVLISRRLEGEFLNYRKSIPTEFAVNVKADRTELMKVVDRVSLIIDDKVKNPIRCIFNENEIKFTCVTALGKAEDFCKSNGDGEGLEIGFNNRYLRDALKVAPSDNLNICLNNGYSPCVILPDDESLGNFLYMVLPVRLKAGEQK